MMASRILRAGGAARIQEVVLDQLLGKRAAALFDWPGAGHPQRAQDAHGIDAMVGVEVAVLDGLQGRWQQRGNLVGGDDDAILAMDGEDAADEQAARSAQRRPRLPLLSVRPAMLRVTGIDIEQQRGRTSSAKRAARRLIVKPIALHAIGARPVGVLAVTILQALQLMFQVARVQRLAGIQLQRRCKHLGRQRSSAGPRTAA